MQVKKIQLCKSRSINKTTLYSCVVVLILLLQNGFLKNFPIVLLFVPILFTKFKVSLKLGKLERIMLLYMLYLLVITMINLSSNYNVKYTMNLFVQCIIIYVCTKIQIDKIDFEKFLLILKQVGIINSLLCIIEALCKKNIWAIALGKASEIPQGRATGIFSHPIICGCFLMMTYIISIVYQDRKISRQIFNVIVILSAIILTKSRNAWIATAFVTLLFVMKFHKNKISKKYVQYTVLLIVIILTGSILMNINIVESIINFINARIKGSLQAGEGHIVRIEIILSSIKYWRNHLFDVICGRGKNYGLIFLKENPVTKFGTFVWDSAIDNQYITLIHETGLIGGALILYIIIIFIKRYSLCTESDRIQIVSSLVMLGNAICLFFFEGFQYPVLVLFYVLFIMMSDRMAR